MTSTELQARVLDLAAAFGWHVAHFRPAQTKHGWRTPVGADGKGFPDLVLVTPPGTPANMARVLFRELKGPRDKLRPEQEEWGVRLTDAGADWAVWRPADWPEIVSTLTFGRGRA